MTTTTKWLDHPLSLSSHYLALLDTPAHLSLVANIFLKETFISEVSKKIPSTIDNSLFKQQKEFFLHQQLIAIQCELSAVQRDVSSSTTSSSTNTGAMTELDDANQHKVDDSADLKKMETIQSSTEEWKMGMREWRRLKRIPQGSVKHELCMPSCPFSFTTPLRYTMQLEVQPQFHDPTCRCPHSLLPPLLFVTKCSSKNLKATWCQSFWS